MIKRWMMITAAAGILGLGIGGIARVGAQQAQTAPSAVAQTAATPAGSETGATPKAKEPTMIQLLQKGGAVMYPLYLCSIILVAFAIERFINLRREKILPAKSVERLKAVTDQADGNPQTAGLLDEFRNQENPLARIVTAGLRKSERPLPEIEKAIEDAGAKEADILRRNCRILSTIATVAPLLGLLGTVTGMVRAFMTVAAREEALGRTELLAAGIYEALITTVVGLVIAIPAIVLYHFFVDRVHRLIFEIDRLTTDMVDSMQSKFAAQREMPPRTGLAGDAARPGQQDG